MQSHQVSIQICWALVAGLQSLQMATVLFNCLSLLLNSNLFQNFDFRFDGTLLYMLVVQT